MYVSQICPKNVTNCFASWAHGTTNHQYRCRAQCVSVADLRSETFHIALRLSPSIEVFSQ